MSPNDLPSMSIVLPLLNGAALLEDQLSAIAVQEYAGSWELIVADNGSTDDGPAIVRSWEGRIPGLRIVDAAAVRGVSFARNTGARAARGDVVVLCDADDVVQPGWLSAMAAASCRYDLVGGQLDETLLNEEWLSRVRPFTQYGQLPLGLGFMRFSCGANFAARTSIIEQLGGWDESFRGGGDDIDFCWRAQRAGFSIGFAPDAVVAYRHRPSVTALGKQFHNYGMMETLLYKRYRAFGLRRSSVREGVLNWCWIAWNIRDRWGTIEQRGVWHRKSGHRSGRLRGSLKFRTVFL
jgi:glycosyltransferase involved in cell wall biosynthesis